MRDGKWFRWLCWGLLAVGLSDCTQLSPESPTATAKTESYRAPAHHKDIHRLLIVSAVWPVDVEGTSSALKMPVIETALVNAFGKCGIVADILPQDRRSLAGDYEQAASALSPDALLVLETRTFETGIAEGGGVYLARIVDMTTKQLVWQGQTSVTRGKSREEAFTASILDRLKGDAILCPS